jgi:hypothetical protein
MEAQRFDDYHRFGAVAASGQQRKRNLAQKSPRHTTNLVDNLSGGRYDFSLPVGSAAAGATGTPSQLLSPSKSREKLRAGVDLGERYDFSLPAGFNSDNAQAVKYDVQLQNYGKQRAAMDNLWEDDREDVKDVEYGDGMDEDESEGWFDYDESGDDDGSLVFGGSRGDDDEKEEDDDENEYEDHEVEDEGFVSSVDSFDATQHHQMNSHVPPLGTTAGPGVHQDDKLSAANPRLYYSGLQEKVRRLRVQRPDPDDWIGYSEHRKAKKVGKLSQQRLGKEVVRRQAWQDQQQQQQLQQRGANKAAAAEGNRSVQRVEQQLRWLGGNGASTRNEALAASATGAMRAYEIIDSHSSTHLTRHEAALSELGRGLLVRAFARGV